MTPILKPEYSNLLSEKILWENKRRYKKKKEQEKRGPVIFGLLQKEDWTPKNPRNLKPRRSKSPRNKFQGLLPREPRGRAKLPMRVAEEPVGEIQPVVVDNEAQRDVEMTIDAERIFVARRVDRKVFVSR